MKHLTRDQHLFDTGPKRLLALDGGGVRGMLSLSYLERIEAILRNRYGGDPAFRLCDYFDLISGTSVGAVIAGALAIGYSVPEIQEQFSRLMGKMFRKSPWRLGVLGAKYPTDAIFEVLKELGGDIRLGGDELRTGLMVVAKRLDTGSPWLIHNNPQGKYFAGDGEGVPNSDLLLRQVVRASAAAPLFFDPEPIEVAPGLVGRFVDGGISTANNPALQLFMLATMEGYGLRWPMGTENLLLVSVGTGRKPTRGAGGGRRPAIQLALQSIVSIMSDCDWLNQTLLQWMSQSPTAWEIDGEIGDLRNDLLGGQALLSYLRYNVLFDPQWLQTQLDFVIEEDQVKGLDAVDNPANMELLSELGRVAAEKQVLEEHFLTRFDLPGL